MRHFVLIHFLNDDLKPLCGAEEKTYPDGVLVPIPCESCRRVDLKGSMACCCHFGMALTDEWPEFQCGLCPVHVEPLMAEHHLCARHRLLKEVSE